MNSKPKWVIFDVGNVLYDYKSFQDQASSHLNIEYKLLKAELEEIFTRSMKGEMTFEEVWQEVLTLHGKEKEFKEILNFWWDSKKFVEDTKLLLKQLHDKGYSIALFTNNWPNMKDWMIKNIDDDSFMIKYIFESAVERLKKPDIRFYELVERKTEAKADQIYFIDDKKENLITAKNLGWETFLYKLETDGGKTSNNKIRKQLL